MTLETLNLQQETEALEEKKHNAFLRQVHTCKTLNIDAYVEGLPMPSSSSFLI